MKGADVLNGVSCPTSGLCVALDQSGDVITSTKPTTGAAAWKVTHLGGSLNAVSCPTRDFCVAVGYGGLLGVG